MENTILPKSKQILIGLPGVGKTTFLAALWHLVDVKEVKSSLILDEFHGNREYLNKIRDSWLGCYQPERTLPSNEQTISMRLKKPSNNNVIEVYFPDLSGETYQEQWNERRWSKSYKSLVGEANGALLFVHPSEVNEPTRIDEADALIEVIDKSEHPQETTVPLIEEGIQWEPKLSPTQVQLVELLQFISHHPNLHLPFKICVVISAWDLVMTHQKKPGEWIRERLPLLSQFLRCNEERFPYKIFGVSAQGGAYSNRESLLEINQQSDRIIVVEEDNKSHDLCLPIVWLME